MRNAEQKMPKQSYLDVNSMTFVGNDGKGGKKEIAA